MSVIDMSTPKIIFTLLLAVVRKQWMKVKGDTWGGGMLCPIPHSPIWLT